MNQYLRKIASPTDMSFLTCLSSVKKGNCKFTDLVSLFVLKYRSMCTSFWDLNRFLTFILIKFNCTVKNLENLATCSFHNTIGTRVEQGS